MGKLLPKVLVVSTNAWVDGSGVNTLLNLFGGWDADRIAQIYTKSDFPNTDVCKSFFQISEQKVIKSVFNRKVITGREISDNNGIYQEDNDLRAEQKRYKKSGNFLLSFARELVWFFGKWKTKELERYIKETNPDVLFFPVYPTIYMGRLQLHILKKLKKPYVCYISDDNYTYKSISKTPLRLIHRFFLRNKVKKLISGCDRLMVIAPKQKEEYDKLFNKDSIIITKGIDLCDGYEKSSVSEPIKMLYTGKTIIGREGTLLTIAKALKEINRFGVKVLLDIYTPDKVKNYKKFADIAGVTVHPPVSLEKVLELQRKSDILVFAEALDRKNRNIARLSFSTKITDYLKSGKCIFAVGYKDIAPIDYFVKENSAIVSTSAEEIKSNLKKIINNINLIAEYGKNAYECGKRNHNKQLMAQRFNQTLIDVGDGINATK